jgi:branched-chain amino acid transport system substrate-binding protein
MVSPSATAADLTDPKEPSRGYPIFHRVVANDNFQGPASVRAAVRGVTDPKVYMVDDQTTYGDGIAKNAKPVIKKMATLVGTESVPQKTADYSSVTSKVKASGANVVLYMGYTEDAAKFFKSLRDGGYKGIIAAPDGVLTSDFPDLAGTAAEGVRLVAPDVPFDLAVSKEKLAAFTEATGVKVPGLYVTTSYDAANVFISCFKKGKYNRPGIQNCITNGTFESASGKSLKFNRFGDLIGAVDVGEYLVKNGKIAYIGLA